jgi:hypothetical protein
MAYDEETDKRLKAEFSKADHDVSVFAPRKHEEPDQYRELWYTRRDALIALSDYVRAHDL